MGAKAIAIMADVSKEDQVQAMFKKMFDEFGTIDILINNAGLQQDAPIDTMTLAQWHTGDQREPDGPMAVRP